MHVQQSGSDIALVRIMDVQPDRFTFYVQEAPDRDGPHMTEMVSYLVLETGNWELPAGTRLEVEEVAISTTVGNNLANQ